MKQDSNDITKIFLFKLHKNIKTFQVTGCQRAYVKCLEVAAHGGDGKKMEKRRKINKIQCFRDFVWANGDSILRS
jgi:hypothetical protein